MRDDGHNHRAVIELWAYRDVLGAESLELMMPLNGTYRRKTESRRILCQASHLAEVGQPVSEARQSDVQDGLGDG